MVERIFDPCQAVCRFDDDDICIGCFRRRDDINNWRFMSNDDKRKIVEVVKPKIEARLENEKAEGRLPPSQRFAKF